MRFFRSLYTKIFVWFWLTLAVGALLVLVVTVFTGSQPLGRRWARLTQDMYAHSAMDFYQSEGDAGLERYLQVLQRSSGIEAALLDGNQHNVLPRSLPSEVQRVLSESALHHRSAVRLGRVWSAATPLTYQGRQFYFVMAVHPLRGFVDGTFARPLINRLLLAGCVAAIFCLILTRHIVSPVKALQLGAQRLAAGDLRSRVAAQVVTRHDEIADTARAFDQMADRVQQLVQGRQQLLADISHELRSPLTRISVSLELIQRGELDVIERIQGDVERMNAMIGQILLLTRLDLEPTVVSEDRIDLRAMLQSIARDAAFEGQAQEKSVTLCMDEGCLVQGEANLLRSAFENVLRNAIRHTAAHSVVQITAHHEGGWCSVVICDEGQGVDELLLEKIFDPFFRTSQAREHQVAGTGLGLSISRRIVEMHGGSIRAQNRQQPRGLQILITLPLAKL